MSVGRNEPCPCGSGRKYKNCHYATDRASGAVGNPNEKSPLHDIDNRVVRQIVTSIAERFPREFAKVVELQELLHIPEDFGVIWLAWVQRFEGRTAADWYVERYGWSLSQGTAEWIESQRAATFSIWQVRDLAPGRLTLVDQLTGDERIVHEVALTEVMEVGLCVLARVVDHRGFALLAGCHPHPLRPLHAGEVVEIVKAKVRRRRNIPRERLSEEKIAGTMLAEWTLRVVRSLRPPELRTGDGEGILFTKERWTFEPGDRDAILFTLLRLPDAVLPADAVDDREILFLRESDDTILGSLRIDDSLFELSTMSLARADLLRDRIEDACGNRIRRGLRSHHDPIPALEEKFYDGIDGTGEPSASRPAKSDESSEFLRRYKEEYYTRWLDEPVPALGDQTPREASKTAAGRRKLIHLLDDLAYREGRLPEAERFDVETIREALGLERKK